MLFVGINWLVIFLTTYPIGFFLLKRCGGQSDTEKRIGVDVAAGLVTACVFAQLFSLFYRVSWEALLLFATLSVVCTLAEKGEAYRHLARTCSKLEVRQWIVVIAAAVMTAYCNSVGAYLPDTDMYHAQAIRWIEEYGVVKGLGNAIRNLAYNSSFFPLTALFSMKYVFGRSLHTLQGFWTILTITQCTGFLRRFWKAEFCLSDFAKVGAIYYATLNYRALVSPSSDYAVMFPIFLIAIWYLELVEKREKDPFPYIVLCMIGCNCVTTKLSAGVILLLSICPIVMLIREKRIKPIVFSVLTAVFIILPYLIRNVIISGWLLYPATAIDLFDVPWKMPKQIGEADAYQIHVWGWDVHDDPQKAARSILTWVPHWFSDILRTTEKVLVTVSLLVSLILILVLIAKMIRFLISGGKKAQNAKDDTWKTLLLLATLGVGYFFWQYSAPLPRYGYSYLILLPLLAVGIVIRWAKAYLSGKEKQRYVQALAILWCVGVVAFLGKKVLVVLQFYPQSYLTIDYVAPIDYNCNDENAGEKDMLVFELSNGVRFYQSDGYPGYHPLPVSDICIDMLGDEIRDGFYYVPKNEDGVTWIE